MPSFITTGNTRKPGVACINTYTEPWRGDEQRAMKIINYFSGVTFVRSSTAIALLVITLISGPVQAIFIPIADWHLTSDDYGGLKQSWMADNVYFAVSKSTVWDPNDDYEMLDGYLLQRSLQSESERSL